MSVEARNTSGVSACLYLFVGVLLESGRLPNMQANSSFWPSLDAFRRLTSIIDAFADSGAATGGGPH